MGSGIGGRAGGDVSLDSTEGGADAESGTGGRAGGVVSSGGGGGGDVPSHGASTGLPLSFSMLLSFTSA